MQNTYAAGSACCFEDRGGGADPTAADNTVLAGAVSTAGCGTETATGCKLATAYFPFQVYKAGYCPAEALRLGTLFPELVSDYTFQGGCNS